MPDAASTVRFHGEPAEGHHLFCPDREACVRRHGAALDALIGRERAAVPDIVWLMPEETGFFQPLPAARAAAA